MAPTIRKPATAPAKALPASDATGCIRLRGVRQNNLKGFDLDVPLGRLVVITGRSGSGKSSLAFETLYAEGQRRYVETFTPYARQFFDRMDKPAVDRIENIPPAIAIEQRNAVRTSRSTVGTMTEVCDHLKVLWPQLAQLHCRKCARIVRREPPATVWEQTNDEARTTKAADALITFELPLTDKLPLAEQLGLLGKQGFRRLLVGDEVMRLEEAGAQIASGGATLTVVADRVRLIPGNRARFVEACEQAYHFGRGKLTVRSLRGADSAPSAIVLRHFSVGFHCAHCDLDYQEPTPSLFSYNNPVGACPTCKGFGRVIGIDLELALPDRSKTLAEGVVKPWQTGMSAECQDDLIRAARRSGVPANVAFNRLSAQHQHWVMEGEAGYNSGDPEKSWPKAWYGVRGYFRWLESKSYKMHVRVLLSRYRSYKTCPDCGGRRFNADSLLFRLKLPPTALASSVAYPAGEPSTWELNDALNLSPPETLDPPRLVAMAGEVTARWDPPGPEFRESTKAGLTLADFYALPIRDAHVLVERLAARHPSRTDPFGIVLEEVRSRLGYLVEVGLDYLTLDRTSRTLSGGETERVNLTTCLGTRLVNTLFILDEPSVGLHPRDTHRLIRILHRLRDAGNTVVVVEHEASVMHAADHLIDLGPGHGESGGQVVFQGSPTALAAARNSLTADYLTGRKSILVPRRRPVALERNDLSPERAAAARSRHPGVGAPTQSSPKPPPAAALRLQHATANNLRDLAVEIPLGRFVCLTGVSGSGKTTLVREVLLPLLQQKLSASAGADALEEEVEGESREDARTRLRSATLDGWNALGAAVLVDQAPLGRTPRSNPAVYVGAFEDVRDFFAATSEARDRGLDASAFSFNSAKGQCERCRGAGFEKIEMQFLSDVFIRCPVCHGRRYREHVLEVKVQSPKSHRPSDAASGWSIADLLDAPVEDAVGFLGQFADSKPASRAAAKLRLLCEVGLGYLKCGQPINTLSGGEAQRLKLASHLAESAAAGSSTTNSQAKVGRPTLFLFDEPTTGLHFDDVRVLLAAFQRLVEAGHSVLVIEHNLELIKCADWVIDLGPEAGDQGGRLVVAGTPEQVAACAASHTGRFLREILAA